MGEVTICLDGTGGSEHSSDHLPSVQPLSLTNPRQLLPSAIRRLYQILARQVQCPAGETEQQGHLRGFWRVCSEKVHVDLESLNCFEISLQGGGRSIQPRITARHDSREFAAGQTHLWVLKSEDVQLAGHDAHVPEQAGMFVAGETGGTGA